MTPDVPPTAPPPHWEDHFLSITVAWLRGGPPTRAQDRVVISITRVRANAQISQAFTGQFLFLTLDFKFKTILH